MYPLKTLCTAIVVASCITLVACEGAESRKEKYIGVGLAMLAQGDLDKARVSFKNVLKIDPKDVKANFYFAQTLEKLEDWPAAAAQYKHVLDLDPENTEAAIAFGKILLLAKASDQALEQADNVLKREATNADALILKAGALLLKANEAEATQLIDKVIGEQPGHADAAILKSSVLFEKRDYAGAEKILNTARIAHPRDIPVLLLLSKVYAIQHKSKDTESTLQSIVDLEPRPENYARLSEFLFKDKRFAESETILVNGIEKHPYSEPLKRMLVDVIENQGDLTRAEKKIREFIETSDEPEVSKIYLAEKLFSWQREEDAVSLLEEIAGQPTADKAALSAMNLLALYKQSKGELDAALALVNKVLESNANDPRALNFRARVFIEKGDYDSAISDLRAALNQEKRNPQLMKPLVVAYLKKGDIDLAVDQVKTLLTVDAMNIETRTLAAQVFEQKKDLVAVEEQLIAALRLQSDSEEILQAIVGNAIQRKAWERVQFYSQRWAKLKPENAKPHYLGGVAEEAMGNQPQALELFKASLRLAPGSVEPATAIVRMYLAKGQTEAAIQWVDAELKQIRNAHLLNLKGEVLLAKKDSASAQKALEESLAMQPDWWIPYRTIAMIHADKNDIKTAEVWFRKGIDSAKNGSILRAEYASLLEKNGNTDEAVNQYRAIVNASSSVPEAAINNLAMLLVTYNVTEQKMQEAMTLANRLETSKNPWYLDTVGWVNLKAGQQEKALQFIERAADAIADQPVIQYHLGAAYFAQNDHARAASALQDSLSTGKKFPGIKEAESLLKKIKNEQQQG